MAEEVFTNDAQTLVNSGGTSPTGWHLRDMACCQFRDVPTASSTAPRPTTFHVAAGDGVTVDSAAFNNAVTALNAADGERFWSRPLSTGQIVIAIRATDREGQQRPPVRGGSPGPSTTRHGFAGGLQFQYLG